MEDKAVDSSQMSRYLKQGALVLAVSLIAGFLVDYLFNLTLSRALPSHEYGDYKVALAFASITGVLVLLGGDRVAPRILSAPLERGDNRCVWEFLHFYLMIALSLSLLVIVATYAMGVLHIGSTDPQHHHPLLIMSFAIPLIAIGALLSRVLQAAKLLAHSNLPWRIILPILKVLLLLLLMFALPEVLLWQVIATGALSVSVIIIWQWHTIKKRSLLALKRAPGSIDTGQILKLSIPMMLAMLITLGLNQIDLFMLELLGDDKEVGYFAAASTTAHILPVAQVTIAGLFLPLIAPAIEKGQGAAAEMFRLGQKFITLTVIVLVIVLAFFGSGLLSLFGDDFLQAEQVLTYLTAGYALWALAAFASTWLLYSHKGAQVVLIGAVTLVLDASCNLWLIPQYGMNGAAMATCISLATAALLTGLSYFRHSYSKVSIAIE